MKIRIHQNSVRFRLSKSEVEKLETTGYLEESTAFPNAKFIYAASQHEHSELTASFENNKITLFVPSAFLQNWTVNNIVGTDANMPLPDGGSLYLLIEKDFKCLDNVDEDQSDNYDNPKTC